jgi:hypothetical protein
MARQATSCVHFERGAGARRVTVGARAVSIRKKARPGHAMGGRAVADNGGGAGGLAGDEEVLGVMRLRGTVSVLYFCLLRRLAV